MNCAGRYRAMALVAEGVDRRHIQQPRILRSVRCVATHASFRLDCGMLVHEWSACLGVALGANRILIRCGLEVVVPEGAVSIMAVAALDQTLIHLVVERHIECRLHVGVALEAERRLRSLEQCILLAVVDVVATGAADVGLGVRRTVKVGMRASVALQAGRVHLFRGGLGRVEDLCHIAAAFDVCAARTVATFAIHTRHAVLVHKLGVRIAFEFLGYFFVARSANFTADVGVGCRDSRLSGGRLGNRSRFGCLRSK